MVSNPMQRKARNSFLLGMIITIIIAGAIIALLLFKLSKMQEAENQRNANSKIVYVLAADIKSGDKLSASSLNKVTSINDAIPSDAITPTSLTDNTVAKIDLKKGTILTSALIQESGEETTNDLRTQEYNMIKIPSQIKTGDCIDIRLRMPSGLDYIVVSKKYVEMPQVGGVDSQNTIWVKLSEAETLAMSNAIVENYIMPGSELYTAAYVEPGMQTAATPTYVPSGSVQNLISKDPNIVQQAKNQLINMYNSNVTDRVNNIDKELSANSDKSADNIQKGVAKDVTTAQDQRKAYLDALSGKD